MEELHELTGLIALLLLSAMAISGLLLFRYRMVASLVRYPILKQLHRGFALILTVAIGVHYMTTDERHYLLLLGLSGIVTILLLSLAMRYTENKKPLILLKLLLLMTVSLLLLSGHELAEEHEHEGIQHSEYHHDHHSHEDDD